MITLSSTPYTITAQFVRTDRPPVTLASAVLGVYGWSLVHRQGRRQRLRQMLLPGRRAAADAVERTAQLRIGALPSDSTALAPPGG